MSNSVLYTGNGDKGYTSTLKNKHIPKYDNLLELIGTIDEYSASLGLARAQCADDELCEDIKKVQKKLVSIMGELAGGEVRKISSRSQILIPEKIKLKKNKSTRRA